MPDEDSWRDLPRGGFSSYCQTYPYQQSILPAHDTIQNRESEQLISERERMVSGGIEIS